MTACRSRIPPVPRYTVTQPSSTPYNTTPLHHPLSTSSPPSPSPPIFNCNVLSSISVSLLLYHPSQVHFACDSCSAQAMSRVTAPTKHLARQIQSSARPAAAGLLEHNAGATLMPKYAELLHNRRANEHTDVCSLSPLPPSNDPAKLMFPPPYSPPVVSLQPTVLPPNLPSPTAPNP